MQSGAGLGGMAMKKKKSYFEKQIVSGFFNKQKTQHYKLYLYTGLGKSVSLFIDGHRLAIFIKKDAKYLRKYIKALGKGLKKLAG